MKRAFLTIVFSGIILLSTSQSLDWVKMIGGTDAENISGIALDAAGNIFLTGQYEGTVDFDPGPGVFNITSLGYTDVFVTKLDASGNFRWAKSIGSVVDDMVYDIAVDADGGVYFTGMFFDTLDVDPGSDVFNIYIQEFDSDAVTCKFDSSGNFIWAKQFGGLDSQMGLSVNVDFFGNIYISGEFLGTVDFDPGAEIYNLTSTSGEEFNVFITKLDATGNFVWAQQIEGIAHVSPNAMAFDVTGNVYLAGGFSGKVVFNPGTENASLTSMANIEHFICKLTTSGKFLWARQLGGIKPGVSPSIATDPSGNSYVTGVFEGTADFGTGSRIFTLTSLGGTDAYISKLDSLGNFIWAKQLAGTGGMAVYDIATDIAGNVYTTGSFTGTADFDPGTITMNFTATSLFDTFISKVGMAGDFVWAQRLAGNALSHGDGVYGSSIKLDKSGSIYTTGGFMGTIDFDPGLGIFNITSAGGHDVFVHKVNQSSQK